jgi:hypothetical protein
MGGTYDQNSSIIPKYESEDYYLLKIKLQAKKLP